MRSLFHLTPWREGLHIENIPGDALELFLALWKMTGNLDQFNQLHTKKPP